MEASEKPQLPLDGIDQGAVRAIGDRLVIERLELSDERAARVVRERAEAGQPPGDTITKAIEIGARVLDTEETAVNVDYVRAEFERHAGALRERLSKALETGDQQLAERIAETFDGDRDGSVQKEIDKLVTEALEQQRTKIAQLFSAEDGANPLTDFKAAVVRGFKALDERQQNEGEANRKRIEALQRQVIELREREDADERVATEAERGTAKGFTFEERVHEAIERIASARGDSASHTGAEGAEGGGKKGDTLVELGAARGPLRGSHRLRGQGQEALQERRVGGAERRHGFAGRGVRRARGRGRGADPVRPRAADRVRGQQADRRGRPRGARLARARGRLPACRGENPDGPGPRAGRRRRRGA